MSIKYGENLLGISNETIANIPIIGNPTCEIRDYTPGIKLKVPKDKKYVAVEWKAKEGTNGGRISFMFSDRITSEGFSEGTGKFIATFHSTDKPYYNYRSPHEGVASIFTSLATINLAAESSGKTIQHVVIANRYTVKFFERLRNAGMYVYADLNGNSINKPLKTDHGILFTARFPVKGLSNVLGDFEIKDAANLINKISN